MESVGTCVLQGRWIKKKNAGRKYILLIICNISFLINYMVRTELSFVQKMTIIFIKKLYMTEL